MSGIINSAGSKSGVIGTTVLERETGTWTPQWHSAAGSVAGPTNSTSTNDARYFKEGRQVFFYGYANANSLQNGAKNNYTGNLSLVNFPFAAPSNADFIYSINQCQNWDSPNPARGVISAGSAGGYLLKAGQADMAVGAIRIQAETSFAAGSDHNQTWFSGSYYIAD